MAVYRLSTGSSRLVAGHHCACVQIWYGSSRLVPGHHCGCLQVWYRVIQIGNSSSLWLGIDFAPGHHCGCLQVWYRVIQIVINRDDVQGYAAKTVFEVCVYLVFLQLCVYFDRVQHIAVHCTTVH